MRIPIAADITRARVGRAAILRAVPAARSSRCSARPGWGRRPWPSRSRSACAPPGRIPSPSPPTRCRSTAASRCSRARRRPPSAPPSSTGSWASCPSPRAPRPATTRAAPTRRSTRCWPPGRRPIVVGGTGLYLRAALADLDLRPPPPAGRASAGRRCWRPRAPRPCTPGSPRATRPPPRRSRRPTGGASRARSSSSTPGRSRRAGRRAALGRDTRHPTLLVTLTMERAALYARIDARVAAMVRPGRRGGARRGGGRRVARAPARRSGSTSSCAATWRPCRRAPAVRQAPAHLAAQAPGRARARRHGPRARRRRRRHPRRARGAGMMRGRDAVREVAGAGQRLPHPRGGRARLPAHPRRGAAALLAATSGRARTASSALAAGRAGLRRAPAHLQPRRLRGRAVGQRRARGDPLPAPRRLDGPGRVRHPDRGRPDPPHDHRPGHLPRRHGARDGCAQGLPRRSGRRHRRGRRPPLPARLDRQPAVRDPRRRRAALDGARPRRRRAGDRARPAFPNRTNVSF